MDEVRFYSLGADYGCFSNFSPHPVELKGKTWPTTEHYFQAQKFAGTPDEEEVRRAKSPKIAARMGRSRKRRSARTGSRSRTRSCKRRSWPSSLSTTSCGRLLLGTGDANLIEHTENDAYWGDGGDGRGKNRLGQILMRVREQLRGTE